MSSGTVCWSDDTKLELFGNVVVAYVWQKEGEAFDPTTQFSKKNIGLRASYFGAFLPPQAQASLFR